MRRSPLLLSLALALVPLVTSAADLDAVVVASNSSRPPALRSDATKQVLSTLEAYEKAYEAQDLARLGAVWSMDPVERTLVEKSWDACQVTGVDLKPGPVETSGSTAKVRFDQATSLRCGNEQRTRTTSLEASLRRDASGQWSIASIENQPGSPRVSALADTASSGDEREVLAMLDQYAAAFAACNTPELATLWISNRSERQAVQSACHRDGRPEVSLSDARVKLDGQRSFATVDFVQSTAFGSRSAERSQLRATLVKRGDGEWSIWQIKDHH